MWKWFNDCKTSESGKKKYHSLSRKYHPDNGGSADVMKEINSEFSEWWKVYKDIHETTTGETYKSKTETKETASIFIKIIENLGRLKGIEIEICGSWIWLSGNTYIYREELKSFGCRWSKGKHKWYWTLEPFIPKKSKMTMNDIRRVYGSETVSVNHVPEIE